MAGTTAFVWSFAEATLFFVVPDVLIGWIALRRGWRLALLAAIGAAAGAALGGGLMNAWSAADPTMSRIVETVPAVPDGAVSQAAAVLRKSGLSAAVAGSFSGSPYKVWSAASQQAGWGSASWALAAFPVRLPRFVLIAIGFTLAGRLMRGSVRPKVQAALFVSGWLIFYALFWTLSPW